jgi:hypothetical protein
VHDLRGERLNPRRDLRRAKQDGDLGQLNFSVVPMGENRRAGKRSRLRGEIQTLTVGCHLE